MVIIDLHVHSTASDGSLTPRQVVQEAKNLGLRAIALTDHDTVAGLDEALAAGREVDLEVIPGIEISAHHEPGSMHILGYFINHHYEGLQAQLAVLQQARASRNPAMIAKLQELGVAITLAEVEAVAGGGQLGRPHIAQVLVRKGYARDFQDAFDRFIGNHGPAYVKKFRFPPADAIKMIREAGGLAVLAHPFTLEYGSRQHLQAILQELQSYGLAAVEAFYPEHTPEQQKLYQELAAELGLLVTGGSDYHGEIKPKVQMGQIGPGRYIPYELLADLRQRLQASA